MFELDRAKYRISNTKFEDSFKVPYPFQKNAIASLDAVKQRNPNGFSTMLVLPTGAGKTFTAVHWIINRYINENVKVLGITATPVRDVDGRDMAEETAKKLGYTDEEVKQRKHLASNMTFDRSALFDGIEVIATTLKNAANVIE